MNLSTLCLILGAVFVLYGAFALWRPTQFASAARQFPRYTLAGYPLIAIATVWFLYNLSLESVSDFANFKPILYALFAAVGLGACIFVRDFLPIRGLAVLLLLVAKLMVDTARWEDTTWRIVVSAWAYIWVVAGMWLTISPWRGRDLIDWATASAERVRTLGAVRMAFGLFIMILALTAFRNAERRIEVQNLAQAQVSAPARAE